MRLIDADKLKQSVTNEMINAELDSNLYFTLECVIADIESQTTAYDFDKVIKKLEELKEKCADPLREYDPEYFIDRAIEIAKSGRKVNCE